MMQASVAVTATATVRRRALGATPEPADSVTKVTAAVLENRIYPPFLRVQAGLRQDFMFSCVELSAKHRVLEVT
jgi:hypothetical protein